MRPLLVLLALCTLAHADADSDAQAARDFVRARALLDANKLEDAIPILLDVIANHRTLDIAEYSANLLLDTYNRLQRYDDLIALAEKLRTDDLFLANRPELAETLQKILRQSRRSAAAHMVREGHFKECGDIYMSITDKDTDETLFEAMSCFQRAGSLARALDAAHHLLSDFPHSPLAPRAEVAAFSLDALAGRFAVAAAAGEQYLARTPRPQARGLALDADVLDLVVHWRLALGEPAVAARTLQRSRLPAPELVVLVATSLIATDRALALRLLRTPRTPLDPEPQLALATALATAACPVALVDLLCARPRDRALVAAARRELDRIPNSHANAAGQLLRTDLALEVALRTRTTSNLAADYTQLTTSADPAIRVAAHARLARLAHDDPAQQRVHLEACIAEARTSLAGEAHLAICERDLGLAPARELRPAPNASPPLTLEAPRLVPPAP